MREYLFRGKRKDNGEWVEGYLVEIGKLSFTDAPRYGICNKALSVHGLDVAYNVRLPQVVTETIGQFTGLIDKNGKPIFEGDILCGHLDDVYPNEETRLTVLWHDYGWFGIQAGLETDYYDTLESDFVAKYLEVVGNVHDVIVGG